MGHVVTPPGSRTAGTAHLVVQGGPEDVVVAVAAGTEADPQVWEGVVPSGVVEHHIVLVIEGCCGYFPDLSRASVGAHPVCGVLQQVAQRPVPASPAETTGHTLLSGESSSSSVVWSITVYTQ